MGDGSLRCLDCQGKFGAICSDLRCALCGTLFRLRGLVLSENFPKEAGHFAEVTLRDSYFKVLEEGETKSAELRSLGGASECPPGVIDKRPLEAAPLPLNTTPKAKPAVKGEGSGDSKAGGVGAEAGGAKEEEDTSHCPEGNVKAKEEKEERKSKKKEKKRREREEEEFIESAPSGRRSSPRRSRSRRTDRSREALPRYRRPEARQTAPEQLSPERIERKTRSREGHRREEDEREARRRSPLRPRSPPGPPPPRASGHGRWEGPIPSFQNRPRDPERRIHREARNKGAKKRRQQALFGEFKAWRKNHRGHPHY